MIKRKSIYIIIIFLPFLILCNRQDKSKDAKKEVFDNNTLLKVNKYLVEKDDELIKAYIKRRKWDMNTTQTGLRYMIYEQGDGQKAQVNKIAKISYTIELLDGKLCYSVDSSNAKSFRIGKGGVESGLEEGILLMREGDKARLIMPPHLAHHLLGNEDKIPPRATIIYDIHLIALNDY